MSADVIAEKMKKIGTVLIILIMCAAYPVRADQQYVLAVGETMVIPCLVEIWSDQSVSLVISNPDVLMSDGSGRAVIALSEGSSDVYVHMTNPDTDIRYTFVVESAGLWETPRERTWPEEAASGDIGSDGPPANGTGGTDGGAASTGSEGVHAAVPAEDLVPEDAQTDLPAEVLMSEDTQEDPSAEAPVPGEAQTDPSAEAPVLGEAQADSSVKAPVSGEAQTESSAEALIPEDDEHSAPDPAGPVPFWEERGSGGISFEVISDFSEASGAEEGLYSNNVRYRPFAHLKGDGDIATLFVCAAGSEVRWKYIGGTLYIEASKAYSGSYRVCARDCSGNIYYFSS